MQSMMLLADEKRRRALGLALGALASLLAAFPVHAQRTADRGSPFAGLAGYWSGSGTVTLTSGATERIRCRATYAVSDAGTDLQQTLRCASDSYNFDLRSTVTYDGGAIRGTWTEATRNASGTVSGEAGTGVVQANVVGRDFSAGLTVSTRGDRQAVTINAKRSVVSHVAITLTRAPS
jgi:hypothetical protein